MNQYAKHDELKDNAKDRLRGKYGDLILGAFLSFLILLCVLFIFTLPLILSILTSTITGGSYSMTSIRFLQAGLLITMILSDFFKTGLNWLYLSIACGQRCYYGDIFIGFHRENLWKTLFLSTLRTLLRTAVLLPGLIQAFHYPGHFDFQWLIMTLAALGAGCAVYIPLGLVLETAFCLLLDFPDLGNAALLRDGFFVIRGHRGRFFLLLCSFLPVYLLCILSLGIGFLWIVPWAGMTRVLFYLELMKPDATGNSSLKNGSRN